MIEWQQLHFLRPWWLLAIVPLLLLCWRVLRWRDSDPWRQYCDPHLLIALRVGREDNKGHGIIALLGVAWLIVIIALAGPAWKMQPAPVYRDKAARMIVLDLSLSMRARDLKPSRLEKAKYKVLDILAKARGGQTGLIVFAAEPFVVAPLTDDTHTIAAQVPLLNTALMPTQGSRVDLAIRKAGQLFTQSGVTHGQVLLLGDGFASLAMALAAAKELRDHGHVLSVIAVGTATGSPVPQGNGAFLKDNTGSIILPKLDYNALTKVAQAGGGKMARLSHDDSDLEKVLFDSSSAYHLATTDDALRRGDTWREEGPWLVLLVLPLALLSFRKGWILAFCLSLLVLAPPSYADPWQRKWRDFWWTQNQQGQQAWRDNDYVRAAEKFKDPVWRAAARYRSGQFEQAVQELQQLDTAPAHYNRGNALAQLGRLPEALQAFTAALAIQPRHADAQYNHDLVAALIKKTTKPAGNGQSSQQEVNQGPNKPAQNSSQANTRNTARHKNAQPSGKPADPDPTAGAQHKLQKPGAATPYQASVSKPGSVDAGNGTDNKQTKTQPRTATATAEQEREGRTMSELQQTVKQWLRQVPDNPGGLLKEKFRRKHLARRRDKNGGAPAW